MVVPPLRLIDGRWCDQFVGCSVEAEHRHREVVQVRGHLVFAVFVAGEGGVCDRHGLDPGPGRGAHDGETSPDIDAEDPEITADGPLDVVGHDEFVYLVEIHQCPAIGQRLVRLVRIPLLAVEVESDGDHPPASKHATEVLLEPGEALERGEHQDDGELTGDVGPGQVLRAETRPDGEGPAPIHDRMGSFVREYRHRRAD